MGTLMHIVERGAWAAAQNLGRYQPASLKGEGFIHMSAPQQVLATANRFYRGVDDLLVLLVDGDALGAALRWEEGEPGVSFPHLYRALGTDEVLGVRGLTADEDGVFISVTGRRGFDRG